MPLVLNLTSLHIQQTISSTSYHMRYWQSLHNFLFSLKSITRNRLLFRTNGGLYGLGPSVTKPGDLMCFLFGGKVPYILRHKEVHYLLIGESYVHGCIDSLIIALFLFRLSGLGVYPLAVTFTIDFLNLRLLPQSP
jgi:hypothetical protein